MMSKMPLNPPSAPGLARLVVHVGPHKTASTATQLWLKREAEWLEKRFGVTVGAARSAKEGAFIANTYLSRSGSRLPNKKYVNRSHAGQLIGSIAQHLKAQRHVLLSSEDFETLSARGWRMLQASIGTAVGAPFEMCAVTVHVNAADRIASSWFESWRGTGSTAQSFGAFVAGAQPRWFESDVRMLKTLHAAFARARVSGVSLERLGEEGTTLSAFLVCNATLRLDGAQWAECDRAISGNSAVVANPSLPPVVMDTLRLVQLAARSQLSVDACWRDALRTLNPRPSSLFETKLRQLSTALPTSCEPVSGASCASILCAVSEDAADAWYALSGARRPQHRPNAHRLCLVDEQRLTEVHWKALLNLSLPIMRQCARRGTKNQTRSRTGAVKRRPAGTR